MPNLKRIILPFAVCALTFICHLPFTVCHSCAQDNSGALREQAAAAEDAQQASPLLEGLKSAYFKNNQYNEFADFLKSLEDKNKRFLPQINYYLGLARYRQLKYLEETQEWSEYFNKGDLYREELSSALQKAIAGTGLADATAVYSRLLLWQYYKDQDDPLSDAALSGLAESAAEYSKTGQEISVIRTVADTLLSYREKEKAKELYAIYAARLLASDIQDSQLKDAAYGFYEEGKLELSERLYDAYIERIPAGKKAELLSALKEAAARFAYQDARPNDPVYAEGIFKKISELSSAAASEEELIYMRAFNLEKAKDFSAAKEAYLDLAARNPEGRYFNQAVFKAGVIAVYLLGDINSGRTLFEGLIYKGPALNPQAAASFYQLGLLSQWEGDFSGAKGYYTQLIDKAGEDFSDTVMLARKRLQEIEEGQPIEYNLKLFLEASLKKDPATGLMPDTQLLCRPYKAERDKRVLIEPEFLAPQAGCIHVEVSYLWSGHTGEADLSAKNPSLETSYNYAGTKEINLVLVSPAGIAGYCLDFIDVY